MPISKRTGRTYTRNPCIQAVFLCHPARNTPQYFFYLPPPMRAWVSP